MGCNTVVVQQPGQAIVKVAPVQGTVIVLSDAVVAKIEANRPAQAVLANTPINIVQAPTPVNVGGLGFQGPPGAPGGSIPEIPFSFGDPAHVVYTATAAGVLSVVKCQLTQGFTGSGASVTLGRAGALDEAFPAFAADWTQIDEAYEFNPDIRLAPGDELVLTPTPGAGGHAGAGYFLLTFFPD